MILQESAAYFIKMAKLHNKSVEQIKTLWNISVSKVTKEGTLESDSLFNGKVIKEFQNQLAQLDVNQAKDKIMTKEDVKRHGQNFLNDLASDNYVNAQKSFESLVKTKTDHLVQKHATDFLKQLGEKYK